MRSVSILSFSSTFVYLASVTKIVQASYGNYPCGTNGQADQSKCYDPTFPDANRQCVAVGNEFACGVQNALCESDNNCDGGQCVYSFSTGLTTCYGGPGDYPAPGRTCLGRLSNVRTNGGTTDCGGSNTGCRTDVYDSSGAYQYFYADNTRCKSGYCNPNTQSCDQPPPPPPATSGRARQRRNQIAFAKKQCPPQQEACNIAGSSGFECVDTMSNIEKCGSCDGNDCTELPGVDLVSCTKGSCVIWSCASGYWHDAETESCIPVEY